MATGRSFAEYVKSKCYSGLYKAAEDYVEREWESLPIYTKKVHKIGEIDLVDATIQRVYVEDLPGMRVKFDVGLELELEVKEHDYHYDESDQCFPWIRITCEGDLECGLDDWEIKRIIPYNSQNAPMNSMSDALVPYISPDQLESVARQFLADYYPEALKITKHGEKPVWVDPMVFADRLGLKIVNQRISENSSIFGQLYMVDTDAEVYDSNLGHTVVKHIEGKTIVVDPMNFLLRNLGSRNNTIIHECVHWVEHRKVFELERLFNASATCISCEVVGGAAASVAKKATEMMERQANALAPRIQMPAEPFKAKFINPTKVITGVNTRWSYVNAWEPKSINGGAPKYSVSLIIPKSDTKTIEKIQAAIQAAYDEGQGKLKGNGKSVPALSVLKTPLRDGDAERPDDEAYADSYFINANSGTAPGIVDADRQPILERSEVYSGVYGRASINFYAFNSNGNKGIACGLNNLQKIKDGEPLGGKFRAEDDFDTEEDDDFLS